MAALTFLHPHIETQVNDNSFVFETADGGGTALFMPYLSDKGEDNKVELLTSLSEFLSQKGMPNYKKHGQAIYNVINWLRGGGRVYGLRVMPEDATYANTVLGLNVTELAPVEGEVTPKGTVSLEAKRLLTLSDGSKLNLDSLVDTLKTTDGVDTFHPLVTFVAKGRGQEGNKLAYRLSLNTTLNELYDFAVYDLIILEKTKNGNMAIKEGPYQVSLFPEAISAGGSSMYLNQVIADYSKDVNAFVNEDVYDTLIDAAVTEAAEAGTPIVNPQGIDLLFGTGELAEYLDFEGSTLAIDHYQGISLEAGTDGSFDIRKSVSPDRATAISERLVEVYSGLVDPSILNKKQYPFDIVLDANFAVTVKSAIVDFANDRKDVFAVLDTGLKANSAAALAWRKNEFQESSSNAAVFGQSFIVADPFNAQDIPVTQTYFLASKIPTNDDQFGVQYPFVGPTRGLIDGFKSLDWNPNEYEKEDLYKARINYVEQDFNSTKYMTQLTTQTKMTALSSINNVRVLMKMIRSIQELAAAYQFEFPTQAVLDSFNQDTNNIMSVWTNNGACSLARGSASQTPYEAEQKVASVKLDVVFNNVMERILIEFNIGK